MAYSEEELNVIKHELRQTIQRQMWSRGWSKSDLVREVNNNKQQDDQHRLYLSDFGSYMDIKGKRTFPISVIDDISKVFELAEGELYHLYFGECYKDGKLIGYRSEDFIFRCIVVGQLDISTKLIGALITKSLTNLNIVYEVVKRLYFDNKLQLGEHLIELIFEKDNNRFSKRLAACYFFRFFILRDRSMEDGNKALVRMLEYLKFMPDDIRMEAYLRIVRFYNAQDDWINTYQYAKELEALATDDNYRGEALIYQGFVLRDQENYVDAIKVMEQYSTINDYFKNIALKNIYLTQILSGQFQYVDKYLGMFKNKNESMGFPYILDAYVKYSKLKEAVSLLNDFASVITNLEKHSTPFHKKILLHIMSTKAMLHIKNGNIELGISEAIRAAELADQLGNTKRFKQAVSLIWMYKHLTNDVQDADFLNILTRGVTGNEEIQKSGYDNVGCT
ncbi:hypothetical protein ABE237_00980 [Brevibacillus formosus]|uniref:tetratricopeptide repeat protein n=1 Tax=Brevibacillus formosus TaxID=54913 RepID=UPI0018CEF4F3|nr:hypothetical protein [Brevibacillus formosus]MBG9944717.1 hypothetical protein [Brevibacillus formosus]